MATTQVKISAEDLSKMPDPHERIPEPTILIIFGASGDLTKRKLLPALFHLEQVNLLPQQFAIVGVARRPLGDEFAADMREGILDFGDVTADDPKLESFMKKVHYFSMNFDDPNGYIGLKAELDRIAKESGIGGNRLFYLATAPEYFAEIIESLGAHGMANPEQGTVRTVIEKPFGHDLESAKELNRRVNAVFDERQVFRIDHYLGKETVQNILMFRFSNSIFEQLWNRNSVDHVQITVSEKIGVGARGGYYEEAGALRDMVQNHILQVLSLIAMEPPVSLEAEAVRDEKVKLLKSIRELTPEDVARQVVRGQYFAGQVGGEARPGYRQEPKVKPDSNVETFVALKLFIDNWRWSGVPFYLRTGKNLPLSASEVRIQFRPTPNVLFAAKCGKSLGANALTLRLQPNEGISLRFNGKVPGSTISARPVRMHFSYDSEFGAYTPEAYERLLLEAIVGDATLFIRRDEVETAWQIADSIRNGWDGKPLTNREFYSAGTWGPIAADDLLAQAGHEWHEPAVIR